MFKVCLVYLCDVQRDTCMTYENIELVQYVNNQFILFKDKNIFKVIDIKSYGKTLFVEIVKQP